MKTCLLKNKSRIFYDSYQVIEETHQHAGLKTMKLYQFTRNGLGIVGIVPEERIAVLDADKQDVFGKAADTL